MSEFMKATTMREAFERIAEKLELEGVDVSVCDEDDCCLTYPSDWVIDNQCPFCLGRHTYDEWISFETYPEYRIKYEGDIEPEDYQDTHIMYFSVTPEELRDAFEFAHKIVRLVDMLMLENKRWVNDTDDEEDS